ncbi:hypothetical protein [Corynebacterium macginleyi]|uniref:hypothetical protein n=1 Tax=Corynebacterium macginleyi TaxID=38290 RepID=UPI000EFA147C|nr:hypothetical protein [Corynebacterium macginleyi]QRP21326.1 hypothetical protein I6J25_00015 [Corynebacterium macginleyi]RMB65792.1 hypothetical protein D9V82_07285 [Corynebacterium macginleyi]
MSQEKFHSQLSSLLDAAVFQGVPHLRLSPDTDTVELYLPAVSAAYEPEDPQWTVTTQLLDGTEVTRKFYYVSGEEPGLWVSIPQPFTHLSLTFAEQTLEFAGIANGGLLLNSTHRPVDTTQPIPRGTYTFIAPTGTQLSPVPGSQLRPHGSWEGWTIFEIVAEDSFTVTVPRQHKATITVAETADFSWDMAVKSLPNARGLDGELVYTKSPRLLVNTPLHLQLTYVPIGGEEEEILEDELPEGIHEVLPGDAFEDPWVGRYRFSLYKGEELVDVHYLNFAETLHMRSKNEGPRGTNFRFIDALGNLSPFSYALASSPDKPIQMEKGQRVFSADESVREETISSEAGYELTFEVIPATIRTRVKRTAAEPVDYMDKQVILADQLDADALFTVHSPEPLPLAKFVVIDKNQKIRDLVTTNGSTEATTTLSVPNRALKAALTKKSSLELYLLWSTLSYEEYLEGLPDKERAAHLKRSMDRRVMEYEATAASDLIYAAIATVRKAPLVARATIEDGILIPEQTHEEEMELLAWAWPLGNPASEPLPLEPVEEGFELPEELHEAGHLIVDFREDEPASDLAAPQYPPASSLIIFHEGESENTAGTWETYAALRCLAPKVKETFEDVIKDIETDPRASLDALMQVDFECGQRMRALVRTGLISRSFSRNGKEATDPSSVLAALADANQAHVEQSGSASLWRTAITGIDDVTRPMLLMSATGEAPTPATDNAQLCDDAHRIAALRECFANDLALTRLGTMPNLRTTALQLRVTLQQLGVDKSVLHTLLALNAFGEGNTELGGSAWMPFISYVFAIAARGVANGKLSDAAVASALDNALPQLAEAVSLAPELFYRDILTAEALTRNYRA